MQNFLIISLIASVVLVITTLGSYEILRVTWNKLPKLQIAPRLRILVMMVPIFATHIISIWVYAVVYLLIEYYTGLGHLNGPITPAAISYESFIERLYFSASTYASLGLGDIAPTQDLRMIAAAEVLNGLVLIGWTVSFTYLLMEKFWDKHNKPKH